jgi:hypothetical protein
VKYFQIQDPCGYVLHESSSSPLTNFVISIGPFIVNTLFGALILFPASIEMSEFGIFDWIRQLEFSPTEILRFLPMLLAYWLGVSIIMHAFPSTGDAQALVSSVLKNKEVSLLAKILVAPVIGLIYLGAVGSVFWLDLGYALLVAFLLPKGLALFV